MGNQSNKTSDPSAPQTFGGKNSPVAGATWLRPPKTFNRPKRIAILGATGSIGQSTLNVIRHSKNGSSPAISAEFESDGLANSASVDPGSDATDLRHNHRQSQTFAGRFQVFGLSGHSQVGQLATDAKEFSAKRVVCTDNQAASAWKKNNEQTACEFQIGGDALSDLASDPQVDVVVAAIVGSAGLPSTLAALSAGKIVALANKETLVAAGHLATSLAVQNDARLLPVDSEHNAIFQAMQSGKPGEIRRIILTASGGPFREKSSQDLRTVTPDQALAHPTWKMGAKISIDSATMMNKALEVIEAKWLFDLPAEKIEVVVHPQSIVHSFVEFEDGSVIAQLSPPDMQLPIQFALDYPERFTGPARRMDFSEAFGLNFQPPDMDRFPALLLGLEVARKGGTCGVVLNAANEVVVDAFLQGQIRFPQIATICRQILDHHSFDAQPSLDQLLTLDRWARQETRKCIGI